MTTTSMQAHITDWRNGSSFGYRIRPRYAEHVSIECQLNDGQSILATQPARADRTQKLLLFMDDF